MAIKANFSSGAGLLSVFDDNADNSIVISRDAAGNLLIDDGTVAFSGVRRPSPTPTDRGIWTGGDDTIKLDETNGAILRRTLRWRRQ